jgi:quaternary ammonium compound-resistance protein SugE
MAWIYLLLAGVFEVAFTTALRYIDQTWPWRPLALFVLSAACSFYFLSLSLRTLPLGTAYAVWTGIGAAGTVLVGLLFYDEPADALRLAFLTLLIAAIVGLKVVSPH